MSGAKGGGDEIVRDCFRLEHGEIVFELQADNPGV
jgi:hypothetical protein